MILFVSPLIWPYLQTTSSDGILNAEFAKVLAQGTGSQVGVDSSAAMIEASRQLCKDDKNSTFESASLHSIPFLQNHGTNTREQPST